MRNSEKAAFVNAAKFLKKKKKWKIKPAEAA
jgi:hypothetical protein